MGDPCRTEIEFVRGGESEWLHPREVATWGLPCRFAVIQSDYRPDKVDAYIDRQLWLTLVEFARAFSDRGAMTAVRLTPSQRQRSPTQDDEQPFEAFAHSDLAIAEEDWNPPERLLVRVDGAPELVIAAEFWIYAGGPKLYHDTMTYSIYSKEDLEQRLLQFLRAAPAASGWDLASVVITAPEPPPRPPTLLARLTSWLRRHA